tara:strand:- start:771 stop:1349 length:579 start_codon:yes stop_codon:yes gene_type:complete
MAMKNNIKNLLKIKNITQGDLAKLTKKDRVTINRWVNCTRTPSVEDALTLSDCLHVTLHEIFETSPFMTIYYELDNTIIRKLKTPKKIVMVRQLLIYYDKLFIAQTNIPGNYRDGWVYVFKKNGTFQPNEVGAFFIGNKIYKGVGYEDINDKLKIYNVRTDQVLLECKRSDIKAFYPLITIHNPIYRFPNNQ